MNPTTLQSAITRRLLSLCLSVSLVGCQSGPSSSVQPGSISAIEFEQRVSQHEAKMLARQVFEVGGGLGIWTDDESISARLDWLQQNDTMDLTLVGPMGIGTIQLLDDGRESTLLRGTRTLSRGDNADRVLQQGLGLSAPIPLDQLAFWIRGLPGDASNVKRDRLGKLDSLRFTDEQGTRWHARFRRYTEWDGAKVPALITASGGPFSVRLVLKNWRYPSTTVVPQRRESNNRLPIPGR